MEADIRIQAFINRIKSEAIEAAESSAEQILSEARSEAQGILAQARKEAEAIRKTAESETQRIREEFEISLAQTGRTFLKGIRSNLIQMCNRIMESEVKAALGPELMGSIILQFIQSHPWDGPGIGWEIQVNEEDLKALEGHLIASMGKTFKKGVTLKPLGRIRSGFRIGERDGHVHYDFTEKAVAESLGALLNPRLARYLDPTERTEERLKPT